MHLLSEKFKAMILVFWIPIAIAILIVFLVKDKNLSYLATIIGLGIYFLVLYFWKKEFVKAFIGGMYNNEEKTQIIKNLK